MEGNGLEDSPPAGGGNTGEEISGTACWTAAALDTTPWTTAGGDFVAMASASTLVPTFENMDYSWSGSGVVADVQAMRDGAVANHGWILVEEPDAFGSGRAFLSSEAPANLGDGPRLVVEYEIVVPSESYWELN